MKPTQGSTDIPQLLLEKQVLGELSGRAQSQYIDGYDEQSRSQAEAALSEEQVQLPPLNLTQRESALNHHRRTVVIGVLAAGLAVVVYSMVLTRSPDTQVVSDPLVDDTILLKGDGPRLHIYRKKGGGFEHLVDGTVAHPGDRLQLRYQINEAMYGVILSKDGRGHVTQHLPLRSDLSQSAVALTPGRQFAVPHSYELDDAPSYERFFLIVSPQTFAIQDAIAVIKKSSPALDSSKRKWQMFSIEVAKP